MKTFEAISLDLATVSKELDELEVSLAAGTALKERAEIMPFFSSRKQLSAAIGYSVPLSNCLIGSRSNSIYLATSPAILQAGIAQRMLTSSLNLRTP